MYLLGIFCIKCLYAYLLPILIYFSGKHNQYQALDIYTNQGCTKYAYQSTQSDYLIDI